LSCVSFCLGFRIKSRLIVLENHQQGIIGLPHLDLRLAIGVDLSSVEEVAAYVTISLLNSIGNLGG